jgi:hypothetical protein
VGDTLGLFVANLGATLQTPIHIVYYCTMPSNSAVTIKPRWKVASGTAFMYNRSAVVRPYMTVTNLGQARGG